MEGSHFWKTEGYIWLKNVYSDPELMQKQRDVRGIFQDFNTFIRIGYFQALVKKCLKTASGRSLQSR